MKARGREEASAVTQVGGNDSVHELLLISNSFCWGFRT